MLVMRAGVSSNTKADREGRLGKSRLNLSGMCPEMVEHHRESCLSRSRQQGLIGIEYDPSCAG